LTKQQLTPDFSHKDQRSALHRARTARWTAAYVNTGLTSSVI